MKKSILLLAALLLTAILPAAAQTEKYYIDGREATREEVMRLTAKDVEAMKKSVENAQSIIRITLRPGAKAPAADTPAPTEADSARRAKAFVARIIREKYEQTTLLKEGAPAADFTAAKYAGGEIRLGDLRGKVVLLTFWATWCGPCLRELAPAELPEKVLKRFAGNTDFVFLPVAYTDTPETLDRFFASDNAGPYLYLRDITAMDSDKSIHGRYATQSIPRSFVIDRSGRIVCGSLGAAEGETERVAAAIEAALQEEN